MSSTGIRLSPRPQLKSALARAREQTDALFELVRPGAMYERPIPERHRMIFYLGHLEASDWNQVCRGGLGMESFHAGLDRLFAFGIDPKVGSVPDDVPSDWPSEDETRRYNRQVREKVDAALANAPEQLVHVAVEHRLMHAETFAYMLHQLSPEAKVNARWLPAPAGTVPGEQMIPIPAGRATLGQDPEEGFGWDNEFPRHEVSVPAFAISKYKVTNGEYLDFVREGAPPPQFWVHGDHEWKLRGMFGEIPLPSGWPVYVTHDQASAYAAWKGKALPSEAQFHRAAYGAPDGSETEYPWGSAPPDAQSNFDFIHWDPVPVTACPEGDSRFGVSQLVGNGWEWTSTTFEPFPGFEPFPFYPGYSANFFDREHFVMKGGSPRTAAALLRRSFRNWFRHDYPYAYTTFRMVEN